MNQNTVSSHSNLSFKQHILIYFAVSILVFALFGALVTGWLASQTIADTVIKQGYQVTANFARHSILGLLYGDDEGVSDAADIMLRFPDVKHVSVYSEKGHKIFESGEGQASQNKITFNSDLEPLKPVLTNESDNAWFFVAAVYDNLSSSDDHSPFSMREDESTLLGYVHVTIDKSSLNSMRYTVFIENIAGIFLFAIIFLLILMRRTTHLTQPLNTLASLMNKAEQGLTQVRADIKGTVEVQNMARAFNTMIAALEERSERLETQKLSLQREVAERQLAEKNLLIREGHISELLAKLEAIMASVPGILFQLDRDAKLIWWNKALEETTGIDEKTLLNNFIVDLVEPNQRTDIEATIHHVFDEGYGEVQATLMGPDASIPYQFRCVRIGETAEQNTSFIGVGMDVTTQVAAQAALKEARDAALVAVKLKSEFLANMSHEIRTPLNGLLGMLQLLSDTTLDEEQREYAEIAERSGDVLLKLINDILDFSKIESGKLELEIIDFELSKMLDDTLGLYAPKADSKGIGIRCVIEDNVPTYLKNDPTRIRQVLSNLIDNAIKFTADGCIEVRIKCLKKDIKNNTLDLLFSVKDSGIGIEQDAQEKIFSSFVQGDGSATRKYGGTGLGLSIAKQLVELMGGQIVAESEVGKGSTFSFTTRQAISEIQTAEEQETDTTNELACLENKNTNSINILVAEDNEINQGLVLKMLSKMGYSNTDVACNGEEALAKLAQKEYDIILMDCQMPVLDGYQATLAIRESGGKNHNVTIIAVTGNALNDDEEKCFSAGVDDYLAKPFKYEELEDIMSKWIKDLDSRSG